MKIKELKWRGIMSPAEVMVGGGKGGRVGLQEDK